MDQIPTVSWVGMIHNGLWCGCPSPNQSSRGRCRRMANQAELWKEVAATKQKQNKPSR